jgi:CBS domain-containing protein/sporulation protein YlmC with PRC-barrel domain
MVYKLHIPKTSNRQKSLKELRGSLISVAGLLRRKIVNQEGQELGSVADVVCHWDSHETYPPLTGIIAKVSWRKVWIPISDIAIIEQTLVKLNTATLDLRDFKSRQGEASISKEVLDHQLIDVDGARVVRASDLYVANLSGKTRLVGVDVGFRPLLRRIGPINLRNQAIPDSVIDWATIESFGSQGTNKMNLKLSAHRQELRRMRPSDLADMLEDLGRTERQELLNALTPEIAADALEEMEAKELESLLRESTINEGAKYLAKMEPDEAADALRMVDDNLQKKLLEKMPDVEAKNIKEVLKYGEETAGGIMNTTIMTVKLSESISKIKNELSKFKDELSHLDSVIIIDAKGEYVFDLPLSNLLLSKDNATVDTLVNPPAPITVSPEASLKEVAKLLVETRSSSIVVTNSSDKPIGRIFADDLLDVLLPTDRFHFPRLLTS